MRSKLCALLTSLTTVVATTVVALVASPAPPALALENGLARTPPMGFNNWNFTHCRAEFNEAMVKRVADAFVSLGLRDVGYNYVNIDDCWALPQRNAQGNLVPDPARFSQWYQGARRLRARSWPEVRHLHQRRHEDV